MQNRPFVRDCLASAWLSTITSCYDEQLINSEHGLQVCFAERLSKAISERKGWRVFIEPRVTLPDRTFFYPDIAICNSKEIVGLVELKYVPRGTPKSQKDLATLLSIANNRMHVSAKNQRYLGPNGEPKTYLFSSNAIFCWAGVYKGKAERPLLEVKGPEGEFLGLHAITSKSEKAIIEVTHC